MAFNCLGVSGRASGSFFAAAVIARSSSTVGIRTEGRLGLLDIKFHLTTIGARAIMRVSPRSNQPPTHTNAASQSSSTARIKDKPCFAWFALSLAGSNPNRIIYCSYSKCVRQWMGCPEGCEVSVPALPRRAKRAELRCRRRSIIGSYSGCGSCAGAGAPTRQMPKASGDRLARGRKSFCAHGLRSTRCIMLRFRGARERAPRASAR